MSEERQASLKEISELAEIFKNQLEHPEQPTKQFAIFIGGFPGSGKTTVARMLASMAVNCVHIQANDARVLLQERGLGYGNNVRLILKQTAETLLAEGHSIILDGAFLETEAKALREGLIRKFAIKPLLVAVNCSVEMARGRAELRYRDGKGSTFGDWRADNFVGYKRSMGERKDLLEKLLEEDHSIKVIKNHADLPETERQVREIWREFKVS